MGNQTRIGVSLSTGLLAILAIASCSPMSKNDFYKQGVVYCSESNPVIFNPQLDTSSTTSDATAHQLYDRLIDYDPDTGRLEPSLASSWTISEDGLTYTFQLRKDVSFHTTPYFTPTRNFNADDVVFSINRWRLPEHPYHKVSGGIYPYFDSLGLAENIHSVRRVNGYRVEIELNQRDSSFIANLATDFAVILSSEYAQHLLQMNTPENIDHLPIGTGPFIYGEYRKNHYIRYYRNDNYWQQQASAQRLIFDITPRSSLRLAKMMSGECDVTAFPDQTELDIVRSRSDLKLAEKPGLNIGFWAFNTQRPPFDNPDVRRALAYAIDKDALLEAVYFDSATRAKTLLPDASWAFQNDANDTTYNPVMARKLLDSAGVKQGFEMTIWAMPVERAYNPDATKMGELIQRYLADVGVIAKIVTHNWSSFHQQLMQGYHDSVLIGWSADNGDPDNFYRPLLSCSAIPSGTNRAMWCNQNYDDLINQALLTEDVDKRKQLYAQINSLLFEQLPLVPIAHALRYQVYREELSGMEINPYGGIRFTGVRKQSD